MHKRTKYSPCLMLAILPTLLPLSLVFTPLPSSDSAPKNVLSFTSHLVATQQSFPPPISVMLSILLLLRKAENAVQVTKSLKNITNQSLSPTTVQRYLKKAGMKAVIKKKMPFSFCQASQSSFRLCSCLYRLDCEGLEKGDMI